MSETRTYFETLFSDLGPEEHIEIRFISPDRDMPVKQVWVQTIDAAVSAALKPPRGYGSFVGVCPRTRDGGAKDEDVARVQAIWADVDCYKSGKGSEGAETKDEVAARLRGLACPPTMLVDSGGGVHAYWVLTSSVEPEVGQSLVRAVAQFVGGDRAVANPSRILRTPGTSNTKQSEPRLVRLLSINYGNRTDADSIRRAFNARAEAPGSGGRADVRVDVVLGQRTQEFLADGRFPDDGGPERNHLLGIARNLCSNGWDSDDAVEALWVGIQKHGDSNPSDPWRFEDIERIVASIYRAEPTVELGASSREHEEHVFAVKGARAGTSARLVPVLPSALTQPIRPPQYLIDQWLIKQDIVSLAGIYGGGKSWLSLALAIAIADPKCDEWLGFPIVEHGTVMVFDEENPEDGVLERLKLLGCRPDVLCDSLYVYSNSGILLDEQAWIEEVHSLVDLTRPVLCVFDSFVRFHQLDENSASDMSRLYRQGIVPISRMYGSAVITLDHPTKAELNKSARGSIDKMAVLDRAWQLSIKETGDDIASLKHSKPPRRGTMPPEIQVLREQSVSGVRLVRTGNDAELQRQAVVQAVQGAERGISVRAAGEAAGVPKTTTAKILDSLVADGHVKKGAGGVTWIGPTF